LVIIVRRCNPALSASGISAFIKEHQQKVVSPTMVKRVLKAAGLAHPPGRRPRTPGQGRAAVCGQPLRYAGAKLLEAADISLQCTASLAEAVRTHVDTLVDPEIIPALDTSGRDALGRFESAYNERYRKDPEAAVGPGFASVERKREALVPSRLHLKNHSLRTLQSKLQGLIFAPVLGGCGTWDGMRTSDGAELVHLCGKAYMPSTLDLHARELKFIGAASTLWETYARQWHTVTAQWGDPKFAAVAYADGTTKPLWTKYFSQSTKVSKLNRIMPGIETVSIHNGYGVPVYQVSCSGRAPLVKKVPIALAQLESLLPAEFGRIVVIDSEGNSIPFLSGLEEQGRAWVTRMRPGLVKGCDTDLAAWGPAHAFRRHEEVQERSFVLQGAGGTSLPCRLIRLAHDRKEAPTYLACSTSLTSDIWSTLDVAALYLSRWPKQEAEFRAINQAVNSKRVRGYGKERVQNISVISKLEQLEKTQRCTAERLAKQQDLLAQGEEAYKAAQRDVDVLHAVEGQLDAFIAQQVVAGRNAQVSRLLQTRQSVQEEVTQKQAQKEAASAAVQAAAAKVERTTARAAKNDSVQQDLAEKTEIYRHDTELDSIFSVLNLTLYMLVTHVLQVLMNGSKMAPKTFIERFCALRGVQFMTPDIEIIRFTYNTRDPEMMQALSKVYTEINARKLKMRSGRVLRIEIEPDPRQRRKKCLEGESVRAASSG
jgi:hypothetical protein